MSIEGPISINDIQPEEVDQYGAILGWRIWQRNIFSREPYSSAANEAQAKKMALLSRQFDKGYVYIYHKLEQLEMKANPGRPRMPFGPGAAAFDMPWYVLEPLTDQEVKTIDELGEAPGPLGSIDRPNELLRPDELRRILAEPNRRTSGSITFEMFKPKDSSLGS